MLKRIAAVSLALLLILSIAGCAGKVPFKYQISPTQGLILTQYTGQDTGVEIPAKIGKNPVAIIGVQTFYYNTTLKSVTIPDSVTIIADQAFQGCKALTSVTIPNSVTYISNQAFMNCTALQTVTIPDSVTDISHSAFTGCSSLTGGSRQIILKIQPDAVF